MSGLKGSSMRLVIAAELASVVTAGLVGMRLETSVAFSLIIAAGKLLTPP